MPNITLPTINDTAVVGVERSDNRKLSHNRKVSTTWVSQGSCPTDCPFLNAGCYAENHLSGQVTRRLNQTTITDPTALSILEAEAVDKLSGRRHLRLHAVGDVTTIDGLNALVAACTRYIAKFGKTVWNYTHAWRTLPRNLWGPVSVLASVQSVDEAQEASDAGYAVAMVVPTFKRDENGNVPRSYPLSATLKGVPCPKMTGEKKDCIDCKLCWYANGLHKNKQVILFQTHGARRNVANKQVALYNK